MGKKKEKEKELNIYEAEDRKIMMQKYLDEVPDIYDKFVLTPFENFIYEKLKAFDLDDFDCEDRNKFNFGIFKKNGISSKEKTKKQRHFGVLIKLDGYERLTKENYIDYSLYDEIIVRKASFSTMPWLVGKYMLRGYLVNVHNIISYYKYEKGVTGIVNLSETFKEILFLRKIDSWFSSDFFNSLNSPLEKNRIELLEKASEELKEYERLELEIEEGNSFLPTGFYNNDIEKAKNDIAFYENEKLFEAKKAFYFYIKEKILSAASLSDRIAVCDKLVADDRFIHVLSLYNFHATSGIDFLLGSYSLDKLQERLNCTYENFDLNMAFMDKTNKDEFNTYLNDFVERNDFREIDDLNECSKKSGIYIMVLDEYKRVYVGQADELAQRIRQHWRHSNAKPFGKLMFGGMGSVISIDSFGPLDTTRIFIRYFPEDELNSSERQLVEEFEAKYTLNRINGGGIFSGSVELLDHSGENENTKII